MTKVAFKNFSFYIAMCLLSHACTNADNNTVKSTANITTNNPDELYDIATEKYRAGEYDEAKIILYHIANTEYNNAIIQNDIAFISHKQKKYDEAIAAGQKALEISECKMDSARAFYNIGISYAERGKYSIAIPYLEDAVKSDPCDRRLYALWKTKKGARQKSKKTMCIFTLLGCGGLTGLFVRNKFKKQK